MRRALLLLAALLSPISASAQTIGSTGGPTGIGPGGGNSSGGYSDSSGFHIPYASSLLNFTPTSTTAIPAAPSTVGTVTIGAITSSSIAISWGAATGTAPITYRVEYSPAGAGTWTPFGTPGTGTTATVTGLPTGSPFDLRVTSINSVGTAAPSAPVTASTSSSAPTPAVPGAVTLAAGSVTSSTIQYSWGAPSTGYPASYTYTFNWRVTGGSTYTAVAGLTALTYTLTGLAASQSIDAYVTAANSTGTGAASNIVTQSTSAATLNTRARFAQDTATAGTSGTAAALFASMTQVTGATTDRNGTMTNTADQTKYTWVAVTQAAAGAGEHFFDGTGFGGFNGAQSTGLYTGAEADPTVIHQTYTDGNGTVWYLYRSSGHSVAITYTLS